MNELIIDTNDLINNINIIKSKEKEDYQIIAVIKGNGYGLDIVKYANFLKDNGINFFAVASYQEVLELRNNNFNEKLLLLTPYNDENIVKDLLDRNIVFTVDNIKQAKIINDLSKNKVLAHIKIDTGLSRYGYKFDDISDIIETINQTPNIEYEGIFSHFSNSLSANSSFSNIQYNRFISVIDKLKENNIDFKLRHICNSSGYFKYPNMHLNAARIGSAFIGCAIGIPSNLKKIGTFHTKIVKILNVKKGDYIGYAKSYKVTKDMKVAILPTGYYDGIGTTLISQKIKFKTRAKAILIDIKRLFKKEELYLDNYKVLGEIGMHDIIIDISNTDLKENDDIYFYIKPTNISKDVKRVYR